MVGTSSSSSSSCASITSFDDIAVKTNNAGAVKFMCSYGGKILPRYPDGKLRYVGGENRVLAVDRSVPFSGLLAKMRELCGWGSASVRCQLPTEDLDALVSVTSDEDLANLIEEYDLARVDGIGGALKIRAFLYPAPPPSKSLRNKGKSSARPPIPLVGGSAASRSSGQLPTCAHGQGQKNPGHNRQFLVHHGAHRH